MPTSKRINALVYLLPSLSFDFLFDANYQIQAHTAWLRIGFLSANNLFSNFFLSSKAEISRLAFVR